ncbi:Transposase IS116/IS110/IS902 family protein [Bosea lathyri]|uniref:Transposase IS116/IS110/IS902 family protein n=1 Tax=Bosea lathyri TaxID=1036778 RepID=A0A1H6D6G3_9HYPH|nr:Transposase IS116/IS110/IS902 family protein [Bosea lathyri]
MMRVGLYRPVHVKTLASQKIRALLSGRRFLQAKLLDAENSIRGLLRNFGLKVGLVSRAQYEARILELIEDAPSLQVIIEPMLAVRRVVREQYVSLHKTMLALARADDDCQLLMSVPGVGPLVALTYRAAVDEPARFQRSRAVGAHFGLAPRTHQSGEIDRRGHISKSGDETLRAALFEAAMVLLRPATRPSALKAWGLRVAKRRGMAKATVAVARRLAVILHRIWVDRTQFRWSAEPA